MSSSNQDDIAPPVEFDAPARGGTFVAAAPDWIESPFVDIPEEAQLEIAGAPGADPATEFRRTLGMFATGVTIVTTQVGDQVHGMTANAFMSVSLRPPLILVSVDRRAKMNTLLREGSGYGVSVLADDQHELSDQFAGRAGDRAGEARFELIHDTPLVQGALAHLAARVVRSYWGGDHSLFLGRVEYARYGEGKPLLFHGGRYESLPPEAAPFSALSPEVLALIRAAGEERAYLAGEWIVREGDLGDELFVILEGTVLVERGGRVVGRLSEGEFFGEIAVLDRRPRTADVGAETPVQCVAVPREALRGILAAHPAAAWSMLETMARRFPDR